MNTKRESSLTAEQKGISIVKWLSGIIALSILSIALLVGMLVHIEKSMDYKNRLENVYQQSFYDAAANMDNIEVKLSKLLISQGLEQRAELSSDIWRQSAETASNLSNLPIESDSILETMKFVNQLGDYVYCLNLKLSSGEALTDEEEKNLESLHERASRLNEKLRAFTDKISKSYKITDHISSRAKDKLGNLELGNAFSDTDANSPDYPKLIYDGPFSDSLDSRDYRFLSDKSEITSDEGASKIKSYFNSIAAISFHGSVEGNVDTLFYTATQDDGSEIYLQLTKLGGYPMVMNSDRASTSRRISDENAITTAEDYAKSVFGAELKGVWYTRGDDNIAYVNLAPIVEDIVYYTDLVKIKISLFDGSILGIESNSFLINHAPKELEPIQLNETEALSLVSKKVEVSGIRLAVIPLDNDRYCLTYEISGSYKGLAFMVYINASTGDEEQILRVVDNKQGEMLL